VTRGGEGPGCDVGDLPDIYGAVRAQFYRGATQADGVIVPGAGGLQ